MTQKVWDVLEQRDLELGPLTRSESANSASPWRHWKLKTDEDGIAWLVIDKQGAGANTLSEDVISELDDVLATIEREAPKGLVIRSGKPAASSPEPISVNFATRQRSPTSRRVSPAPTPSSTGWTG